MKTIEEFMELYLGHELVHSYSDVTNCRELIEEMMTEYGNQQKSEIKLPTEEEIEEAAYSYACCAPIVGQSRMGFRAGVEWLRNQIG